MDYNEQHDIAIFHSTILEVKAVFLFQIQGSMCELNIEK